VLYNKIRVQWFEFNSKFLMKKKKMKIKLNIKLKNYICYIIIIIIARSVLKAKFYLLHPFLHGLNMVFFFFFNKKFEYFIDQI